MYSEEQPGEAATALFIKHVKSSDAGVYTCRGMYASNQQLEATVDVNVYGKFLFQFVHYLLHSWLSYSLMEDIIEAPIKSNYH